MEEALESKEIAEHLCSKELIKALEIEGLEELLSGRIGSNSVKYCFINEYINYFGQLESNAAYAGPVDLRKLPDPSALTALLKGPMGTKKVEPVDILFISRNRVANILSKRGQIRGDYIFYSIIDDLHRTYPSVKTHLYLSDDIETMYSYISPQNLAASAHFALDKFNEWRSNEKKVVAQMRAKGCNHLASVAAYFFTPKLLAIYALQGYNLENMLRVQQPNVIMSNDDCIYTRPLGYNRAKVIVLQSSRMVKYQEQCRSIIFQDAKLKPDYFLASGKFFGKVKEDNGAAEKVFVTGLPRYDVLHDAKDLYSKSKFLNRFGLQHGQKIVLWCTQCHVFSDEENRINLEAMLGALKRLKSVTLIIKQHPAEDQKYTELIKRYIDDCSVSAMILPKDSDIYELLYVCDLMVTRHSTTTMEAIALNKPVIILNLSGNPDPVEYVEEGVAIGVYVTEDLKSGIERLLENDSELEANRERYIERYLYKIDGKATERVMDLLKDILEKQRAE